jgi:protein subunit release factor A
MPGILDPKLEAKLQVLQARREELARSLADPEVVADIARYRSTSKAYAELGQIVEAYVEFSKGEKALDEARDLAATGDDPEFRAMAAEEASALEERLRDLERRLKVLLLPSDPNDAKNVVLEIRAAPEGTRRPFSRRRSSGCTRATPRAGGGRSRRPISRRAGWAGSRRSSPSSRARGCSAG